MVTVNKAKHVYPALMWAVYLPAAGVMLCFTALILVYIVVPVIRGRLGMTEAEFYHVFGDGERLFALFRFRKGPPVRNGRIIFAMFHTLQECIPICFIGL